MQKSTLYEAVLSKRLDFFKIHNKRPNKVSMNNRTRQKLIGELLYFTKESKESTDYYCGMTVVVDDSIPDSEFILS